MSTELEEPRHLTGFLVLTIATVVLYVSLIGMVIWNFSTIHQNRDVLCALKAGYERDLNNSREFLQENPEGIPGIPADLIRRGIEDDRQTLQAFNHITCPLDE